MGAWCGLQLRVDALSALEGTEGLVETAVGGADGAVAPPSAVQHAAPWPHVLCDQELGRDTQHNWVNTHLLTPHSH